MFRDAKNISIRGNFPEEINAEIYKECGDWLYTKMKEYDQAIEQYINTIGYLNPSYVI